MGLKRIYTDTEILLHRKWNSMIMRCYNPHVVAYPDYGGRGIYVCDEWRNDKHAFTKWALANGFNRELTIDRIDVNGPYSPNNCRFVDMRVQANNRRSNHFIELNGTRKTISEWCDDLGMYARPFAAYVYSHDDAKVKERLSNILELLKKDPNARPIHRDINSPIVFMGESRSIKDWANKFGVSVSTIYNLTRRMSYENAVAHAYDLSRGIRHLPSIDVDGQNLTVQEWSKVLRVNKVMLANKLRAIRDKPEYIRRLLSGKIKIFDRPPKDIGGATGTSARLPR